MNNIVGATDRTRGQPRTDKSLGMTANKGLISDVIKKQCENIEAKTVRKVRVYMESEHCSNLDNEAAQ